MFAIRQKRCSIFLHPIQPYSLIYIVDNRGQCLRGQQIIAYTTAKYIQAENIFLYIRMIF